MVLSAGAFYFISTLLPEFAPLAIIAALLMINAAGFLLFWSLTVEGNTWMARRLGRQNIGIAEFHEPGAYFNSVAVNFSNVELQYRGESYKLKREKIEYRANGIPYIHFNVGDSEPVSVNDKTRAFDSTENTGFLRDMTTLIEYMMRNQMYRLLLILSIVIIALVILATLFLHFVSVDTVSQKADIILNQVANIGKAIISPSPSVVPNA
jgi:hypothetical protein